MVERCWLVETEVFAAKPVAVVHNLYFGLNLNNRTAAKNNVTKQRRLLRRLCAVGQLRRPTS